MAAHPRFILPFSLLLLSAHMAIAQPNYQKSAKPIRCVTEEFEFIRHPGNRIVETVRGVDEIKNFDRNGRLILKRRPPDLELVFTYNEESGVVEGGSYNNGQLIRKCIYKHDLSGPKVRSFVDENLFVIPPAILQRYPYEGFGNTLEKSVYDEKGSLVHQEQYSYRSKYRKVKTTDYENGNVKHEYEYEGPIGGTSWNFDFMMNNPFWSHTVTYDDQGIEREHKFYIEGDDRHIIRFVYDEQHRRRDCHADGLRSTDLLDESGRVVEYFGYDNEGAENEKYQYKRDEQGRVIERINYSKGSLSSSTVYRYDDNGNEIFQQNIYYKRASNPKEIKSDTEKKYDSVGNCIEEARYEWDTQNGKPFRKLMNRKFWTYTYYEE